MEFKTKNKIISSEIRNFETPDPNGRNARAIRYHTNEENVTNSLGRRSIGCVECKEAANSVDVTHIDSGRIKEVVIRMIREVNRNYEFTKTSKAWINWSRGNLLKRGSAKKGFDFRISTPKRKVGTESYNDIRGGKAWALRLILTQTFQWDKCKLK